MKAHKLFIAGLAITASVFFMAGCSPTGLTSSQRKAKTQLMQYANGNGQNIISHNGFNGKTNTDEMTFKPDEVKKIDFTNKVNMDSRQKSPALRKVAQQKAKSGKVNIKMITLEIGNLRQQLYQAAHNSGDTNMKFKIMNSSKHFETRDLEQAQLQPDKKYRNQQMKAIQNRAKKQQMKTVKNYMNNQKKRIIKKMQKRNIPQNEQNQVISKVNTQIQQNIKKYQKKLDKE